MPCLTIRRCQCRAALEVRTTPVFLLETPISLKEAPPPPALGPREGGLLGPRPTLKSLSRSPDLLISLPLTPQTSSSTRGLSLNPTEGGTLRPMERSLLLMKTGRAAAKGNQKINSHGGRSGSKAHGDRPGEPPAFPEIPSSPGQPRALLA